VRLRGDRFANPHFIVLGPDRFEFRGRDMCYWLSKKIVEKVELPRQLNTRYAARPAGRGVAESLN